MDLKELRGEIDRIDDQMIQLFKERMNISADIAEYKKANKMPIFVPAREREKLSDIAQKAGPGMDNYARVLYSLLFELSRSYQSKQNRTSPHLIQQISEALAHTPMMLPQSPLVACQGVEGAYSQIACEKIFKSPIIKYHLDFDGVFESIEQGKCQYGILPIENSTAGSVRKVYDLMVHHSFSIVRTFRLKVEHNLLANPGAKLSDIKEVISHEQAISQCGNFLATLPGVKVTAVENTAVAAEMVAQSGRTDIAALSSRSCTSLYDLETLASSVQDMDNNYTRFICISKNLEIYPGSDKTTIMMILDHRPGALYRVLSRLYALGINLTKLESRPLPNREFDFMFYLDLDVSVYAEEFAQLIGSLGELVEEFKYLGSYCEVI